MVTGSGCQATSFVAKSRHISKTKNVSINEEGTMIVYGKSY